MSDIFWPGVISMAVMYVAVFAVGVLATRGRPHVRDSGGGDEALSEMLLAGRKMPLWVAFLTMTATWVGGGYINGTTEYTFSSGILYGGQAGLGYAAALLIGGVFFAAVMRRHGFTTLVDPLESRYGRGAAAALMVPAILAEVIWSAAILVALGTTFGAIVGLNDTLAILLSATVAIVYTVAGGLRSVAYTDVIQLFLILIGLGIAVPFAISAAGGWDALWVLQDDGVGAAEAIPAMGADRYAVSYVDWMILLMLGGIPWNVYFQRVLASRDEKTAVRLSVFAAFACAAFAIPPLLLGLSARVIDWSTLIEAEQVLQLTNTPANALPFLLRYAIPQWVSVIALGAVSAAVMSSVDSSILSASSLVAWNGYKRLIRPDATARQVARLVQVSIVALGGLATFLALKVASVQALWFLCGDLVYCVLFPQLTLALFDKGANRTGAIAGFAVSVGVRLSGGIHDLGIPPLAPWPVWEPENYVDFPFRTIAMLSGLVVAVLVSRLTAKADPPRALAAQ